MWKWICFLVVSACVWASSGSWWWTGKPRELQSVGSQRAGHDWATEPNWAWVCPSVGDTKSQRVTHCKSDWAWRVRAWPITRKTRQERENTRGQVWPSARTSRARLISNLTPYVLGLWVAQQIVATYEETLPANTSMASYSGFNTKFSGWETKIPS